jgi:hypothetical protein
MIRLFAEDPAHYPFEMEPRPRLVAPDWIMPAKSKQQQKAAGAALSAVRGERPKSSLQGASRSMAESMSEPELRSLAKTKRKPLPKRAAKR